MDARTVRYDEDSASAAQGQYAADAVLYAASGWVVQHAAWNQQAKRPTLVVTYVRVRGATLSEQLGPVLRATFIATVVLGGAWLLLVPIGMWLREAFDIDSGPMLVPALASWPVAVLVSIRRERLSDAAVWIAVGLGSIFLAVVVWAMVVGVILLALALQ